MDGFLKRNPKLELKSEQGLDQEKINAFLAANIGTHFLHVRVVADEYSIRDLCQIINIGKTIVSTRSWLIKLSDEKRAQR